VDLVPVIQHARMTGHTPTTDATAEAQDPDRNLLLQPRCAPTSNP
jgi:hypothetical protein